MAVSQFQRSAERGLLLRQHFKRWALDQFAYMLIVGVVAMLTIARAFDSVYIVDPWLRLTFWFVLLSTTYLAFYVAGAMVVALTLQDVYEEMRLGVFSAVLASVFMGPIGGALISIYTDEITFSPLIALRTFLYFSAVLPMIVFLAFRFCPPVEVSNLLSPMPPGKFPAFPLRPMAEPFIAREAVAPKDPPIYMQADDHHVKSVFECHVEMERASLATEVAKWANTGLRIHRSYWVAESQVAGREWEGRQLYLVLKDGMRLPVGRSYQKTVLQKLGATAKEAS